LPDRDRRADDPAMTTDLTALARKLKLPAASRPPIVGGDPELAAGLAAAAHRPIPADLDGRHDWILFFARDKAALEARIEEVAAALDDPGILWIAYPKGSSKVQKDLTRDAGWDSVAATDLMWLGLVSVDRTWSAFSLRRYRTGETRQTFR
jgi:hypothetical protein